MVSARIGSEHGAASWWLLLALLLISAAGGYLWYQKRRPREIPLRPVRVAVADSSGVLPPPDTTRLDGPGGTARGNDSTPPGPFLAPPPDFQGARSVPVASFLAYAGQMQFDEGRGMELVLPPDEFGRVRTIRLEPLRNLRQLDSAAFAQGRILARIRSEATVTDLSVHNGPNYLWVQGRLGSPLLAEVWSNQPLVPPKILPLNYSPRPSEIAPRGKDAFWTGGDITSKVLWLACGRGWCHSEAGP